MGEVSYVAIMKNNEFDESEFWMVDEAGIKELRERYGELEAIEFHESLEKITTTMERVILRYPRFEPTSQGESRLNSGNYFRKDFKTEDSDRAREAVQKFAQLKNRYQEINL